MSQSFDMEKMMVFGWKGLYCAFVGRDFCWSFLGDLNLETVLVRYGS